MKESWQAINQLLKRRSQSTKIVSLRDSNQIIYNKQTISNKMNEFFCSIGETLAADIAPTANPLLSKEIPSIVVGGSLISGQLLKKIHMKQYLELSEEKLSQL